MALNELSRISNLTESQMIFWLGHVMNPGVELETDSFVYSFEIHGKLDRTRFVNAFCTLVAESDALRCRIVVSDTAPKCIFLSPAAVEVKVDFVSMRSHVSPSQGFQRWFEERRQIILDPSVEVFDCALIEVEEEKFVWYLKLHHLVGDVKSVYLATQRMAALYQGNLEAADVERHPSFEDFLSFERVRRQSQEYRDAEAFWKEKLAKRSGSTGKLYRVDRVSEIFGEARTAALFDFVARNGLSSPAIPLLVNLQSYLYETGSGENLNIGMAYIGRPEQFRQTLGLFVNTCPVGISFRSGETYLELMNRVRKEVREASKHQIFPVLNPLDNSNWDVLFNYLNNPFDDFCGMKMRTRPYSPDFSTNRLALHLLNFDNGKNFTLDFCFAREVYSESQKRTLIADFIASLDAMIVNPTMEVGYWRREVFGADILNLPVDKISSQQEDAVKIVSSTVILDADIESEMTRFSAVENVSSAEILTAAFVAQARVYSSQDSFLVNAHLANSKGLIPVSVSTSSETTFLQLVHDLDKTLKDASAALPFLTRTSRQLAATQARLGAFFGAESAGDKNDVFDLNLVVEGRQVSIVGRASMFEQDSVDRFAQHFLNILKKGCREPKQNLDDLDILSFDESETLLHRWNSTKKSYPLDRSLNSFIEEQVKRSPDSTAVVFANLSLTYDELNRRANRFARYLRTKGVTTDVLVGIFMERSLEMIIGLLGILKAGGAYVPIDPDYPSERVSFMVLDAKPRVLVISESMRSRLSIVSAEIVCVDSKEAMDFEDGNLDSISSGSDLAYGIYTSGSTGNPKCALNTHEGIVNRLLWMQDQYSLGPKDRVLQKTPFSFDVSVWEFFWPLMTGARLVFARPGGHKDPSYLVELVMRESISVLHFVPSMLQIFLSESQVSECKSIEKVICSGEALPFDLQERFFGLLTAELHNLYGPTEAAVDVTYWHCKPGDSRKTVPIGRPVANTQMYVLGKKFKPVPIGVPGELCIGGIQLARGYWNRDELTRDRFIDNPLDGLPSKRLYRTGDLAKITGGGVIEYLGRLDNQVKIRGLRIELGEIEAALCTHEAVREAVVIAWDNGTGTKRLAAYCVCASPDTLNADELCVYLESKIPEFMIPSFVTFMTALPLSPNGKVDRKKLPPPVVTRSTRTAFVPAQTETESILVMIWQSVLGLERIGVEDDYLRCGGDSIRAIQISIACRKRGLSVAPHELLLERTIRSLARKVDSSFANHAEVRDVPIELAQVPEGLQSALPHTLESLCKATSMQQIMVDEYERDVARRGVYHLQFSMLLTGREISYPLFCKSIRMLVKKHPTLRTRFVRLRNGDLAQHIARFNEDASDEKFCGFTDISELAGFSQDAFIESLLNEDRLRPFLVDDPQVPLFRFQLVQRAPTQGELLMSFHHAVWDGWSNIEFLNELVSFYLQLSAGEPVNSQEAANVQREFVALEREAAETQNAREFWSKQLAQTADLSAAAKFPNVVSKLEVEEYRPVCIKVSPELIRSLEGFAKDKNVSLKATFLSAFLDSVADSSRTVAASVGVLSSGRSERLSDPIHSLGLFWNIVPFIDNSKERGASRVSGVQRRLAEIEPFVRFPLRDIVRMSGESEPVFSSFNFVNFHNTQFYDGIKVSRHRLRDVYHFSLNLAVLIGQQMDESEMRIEFDSLKISGQEVQEILSRTIANLEAFVAASGADSILKAG